MTVRRAFVATLLGVFVGGGAWLVSQSKAVVWPAETLKWADTATAPGAKMAVLWGDPAKGAYGALKQIPGGTVLAAHTHKNDSRVVMVKGSIDFEIEGKKSVLSAGSYAMIPGGVPHSGTCRAGAACEYFEQMSAPFDSTPVKK